MTIKWKNLVIILLSFTVVALWFGGCEGPAAKRLSAPWDRLFSEYEDAPYWFLITLWGMAGVVFVAVVKLLIRK